MKEREGQRQRERKGGNNIVGKRERYRDRQRQREGETG